MERAITGVALYCCSTAQTSVAGVALIFNKVLDGCLDIGPLTSSSGFAVLYISVLFKAVIVEPETVWVD